MQIVRPREEVDAIETEFQEGPIPAEELSIEKQTLLLKRPNRNNLV